MLEEEKEVTSTCCPGMKEAYIIVYKKLKLFLPPNFFTNGWAK